MPFLTSGRRLSSTAKPVFSSLSLSGSLGPPSKRQTKQRKRQSTRATRGPLIEANELNKWGDRDGREGDTDPGLDDDGFERDTMRVVLRLLTARATQRLIMQLQETDIRVSSWLSDFCSENPPMEGDAFLQKLLRAQPETLKDAITHQDRDISPSDLADRLIIVRHSLAKSMGSLPQFTATANLEVYRKHVESGIKKDKPKYRGR